MTDYGDDEPRPEPDDLFAPGAARSRPKRKPWSIEEIRERNAREWPGHRPGEILDPVAGECAPLITSSKFDDCLIHITRYVHRMPEHRNRYGDLWPARHSGHAWCGVMYSAVAEVAIADATGFACAKCIARCEQLDLPTFAMIPDTGCAVSGGRRGKNLGKKHGPYAPRERFR